jgi:hypothetical protein
VPLSWLVVQGLVTALLAWKDLSEFERIVADVEQRLARYTVSALPHCRTNPVQHSRCWQ